MKKTRSNVLIFMPEWSALDSGVVHSQVLSVAEFLTKNGIICTFFGVESTSKRAISAAETLSERYGINALVFPFLPKKRGVISILQSSFKLFKEAKKMVIENNFDYIYYRSITAAPFGRMLAKAAKGKSVYDVRAALAEEVSARSRWKVKARIIRNMVKSEIKKSSRIGAVSYKLKDYITELTDRKDVVVIPSCFNRENIYFDEEGRSFVRNNYGIKDDEIVLCYSGGVSGWQRIEDIIHLFKLCVDADKRIKVLVLTNEVDKLGEIIRSVSLPESRYKLISVAHAEIRKYLSAADLGVVLREDNVINNVASPIKIAEYLACGLPVVMTEGIGDYSNLLPREGLALKLNEKNSLEQQVIDYINSIHFKQVKEKASHYAINNFTMQSHLDKYNKLYCK